jgi:hypothetical protein
MCKESACEEVFAACHKDSRLLLLGTFKVEVTCSHPLNFTITSSQSKMQYCLYCIPEIEFVLLGRFVVSSARLMNTRVVSRKKRRYSYLPCMLYTIS